MNYPLIALCEWVVHISHSKMFFVSIGWLDAGSDEKCKTAIRLNKSAKVNTYSRSLLNKVYCWHPVLFGSGSAQPLNTLYAVELDELK